MRLPPLTAYRGSSTGALVVSRNFLRDIDWSPREGQLSLYRDIVGRALQQSSVFAYNNGHGLFIDVGTVETWTRVQREPGIVQPYLAYQ